MEGEWEWKQTQPTPLPGGKWELRLCSHPTNTLRMKTDAWVFVHPLSSLLSNPPRRLHHPLQLLVYALLLCLDTAACWRQPWLHDTQRLWEGWTKQPFTFVWMHAKLPSMPLHLSLIPN